MIYAKFKGEGHTIKISGVYMHSYHLCDYCKLSDHFIFYKLTEVSCEKEEDYILFILANPHLKEIEKRNTIHFRSRYKLIGGNIINDY